MDSKRCWMSSVVVFVFVSAYQWLLHSVILARQYKQYEQLWNSPELMQSRGWAMWAANLVLSVLFCVIYTKGYEPEKGSAGQGVRYGFLMGLLLTLPSTLESYFVFPYPLHLIVIWFVAGMIQFVIAGAIVGALYKPALSEPMPQMG